MSNPKKSLDLLRALTELGFTDDAFSQLHHFRLKNRKALISEHRHYCEMTESFQDEGENERVQRRLELVLNGYRVGGFRSGDPRVFAALADAAFHELPPLATAPNLTQNRMQARSSTPTLDGSIGLREDSDNNMAHYATSLTLARNAVSCNYCFTSGNLLRAGIGMAQPFSIGTEYRSGGVAVVSINPGAAKDAGYKEARKQALDRFKSGDNKALTEYWAALATDAENFWNPKYLARLRRLGLTIESIAVGNIALCATAENDYPQSMLQNCWSRHSSQMINALRPGVIILMGGESVMHEFAKKLGASDLGHRVIRMAHFAHREGNVHEDMECERVRELLAHAN